MSEEWRRGWHPEHVPARGSDSRVLIVGAGPAGLEAAHVLGKRGYDVMLAEATRDLGGRVTREAALPGLNEWIRVRDYRMQQLAKMTNVEVFRESALGVEDVLAVGADHVAIATGSRWRRDGGGVSNLTGIPGLGDCGQVLTPDDIMAGQRPKGPAVIFDDDHYYMATVLAELLRAEGIPVTIVTADDSIAGWSGYTVERSRALGRLLELGVAMVTGHNVLAFDAGTVALTCVYSGRRTELDATAFIPVTARTPNDSLYRELENKIAESYEGAPTSLKRIGDCEAPAIIAAAVYSGHRYARELDATIDRDNPLKHDRVFFEDGQGQCL